MADQQSTQTKRIFVISNGFPPISTTGVYRTVALIRRLSDSGHDVTVFAMEPPSDLPVDYKSLDNIPPSVRVVRTPVADLVDMIKFWRRGKKQSELSGNASSPTIDSDANSAGPGTPGIKDWLSWWLQVPDRRTGWFLTSMWAGLGQARRARPDVIYSSAPMWSNHLTAMVISAVSSRPWVADCRDPWRSNPYRNFPYRAHDRFDAWLEGQMVRRAAKIICNTHPAEDDFSSRFPGQALKFIAIPNGFDGEESQQVRREAKSSEDGVFRLVHTGVFYGPRSPEPFLAALGQIVRRRPELRTKMRFIQVGPRNFGQTPIVDIADRFGVTDMIELVGSVDHHRALEFIASGDVAIAASQAGANAQLQIPRKFYEYFGLAKPILVTGGACKAVSMLFGQKMPPDIWLLENLAADGQGLGSVIEEMFDLWQAGKLVNSKQKIDLSDERMAADIETQLIKACP